MSMLINMPRNANKEENYDTIQEGIKAAKINAPAASCPYPMDSEKGSYWLVGWYSIKFNWDIEY